MRVMTIWAGIIAPIFYIIMVTILGFLEPSFSHQTHMMSILGGVRGIRGVAFNLGVVITGALLVVFSLGLHRNINQGKGSKAGPLLIIIGGVALFGTAIFSCNVDCTNVFKARTLVGELHMVFALIAGASLSIAPLFIYFRIKHDVKWKSYCRFTLMAGVLANLPGIVMWISFFTIRISEWEGVIQRLGLLFPLIWIFITSCRMFIRNNKLNLKRKPKS